LREEKKDVSFLRGRKNFICAAHLYTPMHKHTHGIYAYILRKKNSEREVGKNRKGKIRKREEICCC
jgi:hypothetical protein